MPLPQEKAQEYKNNIRLLANRIGVLGTFMIGVVSFLIGIVGGFAAHGFIVNNSESSETQATIAQVESHAYRDEYESSLPDCDFDEGWRVEGNGVVLELKRNDTYIIGTCVSKLGEELNQGKIYGTTIWLTDSAEYSRRLAETIPANFGPRRTYFEKAVLSPNGKYAHITEWLWEATNEHIFDLETGHDVVTNFMQSPGWFREIVFGPNDESFAYISGHVGIGYGEEALYVYAPNYSPVPILVKQVDFKEWFTDAYESYYKGLEYINADTIRFNLVRATHETPESPAVTTVVHRLEYTISTRTLSEI